MIIQFNKSSGHVALMFFAILFYQCKTIKESSVTSQVSSEIVELKIKPSSTDNTITNTDIAHFIKYDPSVSHSKLLLFLPGTNGIPERGPQRLFDVAIEQGYKVINLSYINKQAVAGVCRGENLEVDSECTEKFRIQRIWGTQLTSLIPDEPQDAIINRFIKLLRYLDLNDQKGAWDIYLNGDTPNWDIITVSGQSQGGGMSALIAKKIKVNRIITFSGGWDFSKGSEIAQWYSAKSVTPSSRWYGVYHTEEPRADILAETYEAMAIPNKQIYPLSLTIREGKKAHGEGIRNIVYKEMWNKLFEDATFGNLN